LKTLPFIAPGAPVFRRPLEQFKGSHLEGFVMGISQNEFMRIDSGVNFLEVQDHVSGTVFLRARLNRVSIPLLFSVPLIVDDTSITVSRNGREFMCKFLNYQEVLGKVIMSTSLHIL
jgi:hypothetical protein